MTEENIQEVTKNLAGILIGVEKNYKNDLLNINSRIHNTEVSTKYLKNVTNDILERIKDLEVQQKENIKLFDKFYAELSSKHSSFKEFTCSAFDDIVKRFSKLEERDVAKELTTELESRTQRIVAFHKNETRFLLERMETIRELLYTTFQDEKSTTILKPILFHTLKHKRTVTQNIATSLPPLKKSLKKLKK